MGCQNNTSVPDENALFGCASLLATSWGILFCARSGPNSGQPIAQPLRLKDFKTFQSCFFISLRILLTNQTRIDHIFQTL